MHKLTKGAIAMVLLGSVTFSITNAFVSDHSSKRPAEATAAIKSLDQKKADHKNQSSKQFAEVSNSGNQKTADDISQAEKSVQDQTQTTNVKYVQTTASHKIPAVHEVLNNGSNSGVAVAAIGKSTTATNNRIATAKTTVPATNTKTNSNSTGTETASTNSTAASTPNKFAPGQSKKTTSTPTANNHGKQVSQAAKEKAASHQSKKENQGNKKSNI